MSRPMVNHFFRCSEEPWVHFSGATFPEGGVWKQAHHGSCRTQANDGTSIRGHERHDHADYQDPAPTATPETPAPPAPPAPPPPPPPTYAERMTAIVDALASLRSDVAASSTDHRAVWREVAVIGIRHEQANANDPLIVAAIVASIG